MTAAAAAPSANVLLVEDDPGDVALVEDFFDRHQLGASLRRVADGVEALDYLSGQGEFSGEPQPDLILLDLNMPRMGGRELLAVLKDDGSPWITVPVIVFTTSANRDDSRGCYRDHANAYVTKPLVYDAFQAALREILHFFGSVATLCR